MPKDEPMAPSGRSFLGSGMPVVVYGLLLVGSVCLFVVWGGPLWRVTHTDSHVSRFVVSYLSIIPVSGIILLALKRLSWTHLLTAIGTLWAIKLLVTAPLYYALAPGGALEDIGAIEPKRGASSAGSDVAVQTERRGYVAARGAFDDGGVRGRVTVGGEPAPSAVVYLDAPIPGRPLGASETLSLVMTEAGYPQRLYLATTEDRIEIRNDGTTMNNAHVRSPSASLFNAPVPPGNATQPLSVEEPNLYAARSDTAPHVRASLLVVDHPYATVVDESGAYALDGVPVGEARVVALWVNDEGRPSRAERTATVTSGAELRVDLPIDGVDASSTNTETM